MLSGFDWLNDPADFTAIFGCRVADRKILKRKFVPKGNGLLGTSLQGGVVGEVFSDALDTRFQIDNRNANVVRGVMDKKVNHQLLLLAQSIRQDGRWRGVSSLFSSKEASEAAVSAIDSIISWRLSFVGAPVDCKLTDLVAHCSLREAGFWSAGCESL